jgi:hypothetical protein
MEQQVLDAFNTELGKPLGVFRADAFEGGHRHCGKTAGFAGHDRQHTKRPARQQAGPGITGAINP